MDFKLPEIGEGINTVSVIEILVKENQSIDKGDNILLVETDKASMEIPIDLSGKIDSIFVKVGDLIAPGQKILSIKTSTEKQKSKVQNNDQIENEIEEEKIEEEINEKVETEKKVEEQNEIEIDNIDAEHADSTKETKIMNHASPSIKKLARELGCQLKNITGTGPNSRITKDDVYNYIKVSEKNKASKNNLLENLSKWGNVERKKMNSIQSTGAKRLSESWKTIPHVTQFDEVDITNLDKVIKILKKVNKDKNIKVSYIPFFIKAICQILKEIPIFNTSIDDNEINYIQKDYYNIGVAVNTDEGLLVPVIKNANKKSIKKLTIELITLVEKAKNGSLTLEEMSGGCFTISSLGNIGGKYFTPIINPPEVAILGISKIDIKPMFKEGNFLPKKMLPISLSYDHRIINGVDAANFTNLFGKLIKTPSKL